MSGLIASQAVLALVLVGLGVVLLSLARQIGVLHERSAPVGGLLQKVRQADRIDLDAVQVSTAAGADHDALATKSDVTALKSDIAALRVEIRIIGAIVLAIAAKLFGIFNAVASVLS